MSDAEQAEIEGLSSAEVRLEGRGRLGLVTLDRGHALNALTHDMVRRLAAALDRWAADENVRAVAVRSADARAFSAGGDIRALYEAALAARRGAGAKPIAFFRDEYRLNHRIHAYPKPYVSLIDGIVMGGGVGISINGRYRVAGAGIRFAMPEVGIGFFPDVGATFFLPRLPGRAGTYLALTGAEIVRADCLWTGLATHAVPAARFDDLIAALADGEAAETAIQALAEAPDEASALGADSGAIDAAFAAAGMEELVAGVRDMARRGWARGEAALKALSRASPTSLKVALRQMQTGAGLGFADCVRIEFRIVHRLLDHHDFFEGVRAQIIDKDRRPRWRPATLEAVDEAAVASYLAPLPQELDLP